MCTVNYHSVTVTNNHSDTLKLTLSLTCQKLVPSAFNCFPSPFHFSCFPPTNIPFFFIYHAAAPLLALSRQAASTGHNMRNEQSTTVLKLPTDSEKKSNDSVGLFYVNNQVGNYYWTTSQSTIVVTNTRENKQAKTSMMALIN